MLSEWVKKGSSVLEDHHVFDVDIYMSTLQDLEKHYVNGTACFVMNLHKYKVKEDGTVLYKRKTPDGGWKGVGYVTYDGGEFIKKNYIFIKTGENEGYDFKMEEYKLKEGPENRVLCKVKRVSTKCKEETAKVYKRYF